MLDAPRSTVRGDGYSAASATLRRGVLDLFTAEDAGEVAAVALEAASRLPGINGASLWVPVGREQLECRGSVGDGSDRLNGAQLLASDVSRSIPADDGRAVLTADVLVEGQLTAVLRITRAANGTDGAAFHDHEKELLADLADAAGIAIGTARRLDASRTDADERERELRVVTEMSREITATLDLDRVLRSAVNLASHVLAFDRGAIALYERGRCDIRALAGADEIDAKSTASQDLALRAAWTAGTGERFYLSDRDDPGSDAERTFVQIFGGDLARDGVGSGLYVPLKDEEGVIGILVFEAETVDFASEHQRKLADILANQTTVAVRNAKLYHEVPMAGALGALTARRQKLLAMPGHRRALYAVVGLGFIAMVTVIRWPLRVAGADPVLRPLMRADIRPTLSGVVDRMFVREGMLVGRGAPIAHLRDDELRADRDAAVAGVAAAEREAAMAAARDDAASERLERTRVDALQREADVIDEELQASTLRSPVSGVVLTPRPEERVGTEVNAGDLLVTVGRTDTLELEIGVDEKDVTRIQVGDEVRLRVAAWPQRTFSGLVTSIAPVGIGDSTVRFPVRAVVANTGALLKPGMAGYARVLTGSESMLGRLTRAPARALRLLWWRIWS